MIDPEMRDLHVEWQRDDLSTLLAVTQTHGDNTKTTLYLTRRQADRVAEFVREGNVAPTVEEVNPPDCTCEYVHRSSHTCPSKSRSQGAIKDVAPTATPAQPEREGGLRCGHCGHTYAGFESPCPKCGEFTRQKIVNLAAAGTSGPKGEA